MAGFASSVTEAFDDFGYNAKKGVKHIIGKAGIKGAAELVTGMAAGAGNWGTVAIVAPVAAAFSASLVQEDHLHHREGFLNQYRNHIASFLNKQDGGHRKGIEMTEADMELAAYGDKSRGITGNPVLAESLDQSAKHRNWGVGISAISTILSTVVVNGLMHNFLHHSFPGEGLENASNLGMRALIGGAVSFGLYLPISSAIHWVAETLFGLEKVTINDRIKEMGRDLEKGKSVGKEQVFEAFLQAHPEMNSMIKAGYGRRFARLHEADKDQIMSVVGPQINLAQITNDINSGRMAPEELAFKLYEQKSGVKEVHKIEHHQSGLSIGLGKLISLFSHEDHHASAPKADASAPAKDAMQPAPAATPKPEYVSFSAQSPDGNTAIAGAAMEEKNPEREVSYVKLVGGSKRQNGEVAFATQVGRRQGVSPNGSYTELVETTSSEIQMS